MLGFELDSGNVRGRCVAQDSKCNIQSSVQLTKLFGHVYKASGKSGKLVACFNNNNENI